MLRVLLEASGRLSTHPPVCGVACSPSHHLLLGRPRTGSKREVRALTRRASRCQPTSRLLRTLPAGSLGLCLAFSESYKGNSVPCQEQKKKNQASTRRLNRLIVEDVAQEELSLQTWAVLSLAGCRDENTGRPARASCPPRQLPTVSVLLRR